MKEGEKRISIAASNELQEPEILNLEFEMVGKVSGVKIDDFQKITRKEELKHFEITFDLLGHIVVWLLILKMVWLEAMDMNLFAANGNLM